MLLISSYTDNFTGKSPKHQLEYAPSRNICSYILLDLTRIMGNIVFPFQTLSKGSGFPVCSQFIHSCITLAPWQKHLFRFSPPTQSKNGYFPKMFGCEFRPGAGAADKPPTVVYPNQGWDFFTAT